MSGKVPIEGGSGQNVADVIKANVEASNRVAQLFKVEAPNRVVQLFKAVGKLPAGTLDKMLKHEIKAGKRTMDRALLGKLDETKLNLSRFIKYKAAQF